ncbi:hypothetical protein AWC32_05765 [Mycobacterium xenopi]|uniref:DUF732 domain-containing protein n=2 Tax=Mycobacterium xenopi TaxID=1789 RepID=A0AAD1GZR8_MYCXE|nr:hypothetical protein AWC32_05765 [Mycobacterium xenopi]BBU21821.1 hypothetical protein MYXE_16100 [Mycobacterium xenopi]SPX93632.1 conserved secreted protein [Mycobacterium xenopi]
MLISTLVGVALAVNVAALQPAQAGADPGTDFLARLNWYGIDLSALMGRPISRQDAIELGQDICTELHNGNTPVAVADQIYREMPRITDKQAANLVSAAQFAICPDTL